MRRFAVVILAGCLGALSSASGAAAETADWPHWRGPNRNDVFDEDSGYNAGAWPPRDSAWETNVGEGATSPLVVGDRVLVMGWRESRDTLFCLDAATGREQWKVSYPAPRYGRLAVGDQGLFSGITSTPEFDAETGLIYTLSCDGDLNCWDANRRGQRVWGINLYDRFKPPRRDKVGRSGQRDYGYTSSPLVQGDTLVVEVGSPEGNLMGFDKRTGERLWASQSTQQAGHTGGPVPITVEGVPCVAVHTFEGLLVARLDRGHEGQTVAQYAWRTEFANNIATPAVQESSVLITSGYNHMAIARLDITLDGARLAWKQSQCSKVCSPTIFEGHVYWVWQRPVCLDFNTGKLIWQGPGRFGDPGSCIITGDGRMIVWAERGRLALAETAARSPHAYTELAVKEDVLPADAWPHVVLSRGRLLVKDRRGNLKCFVLAAADAPEEKTFSEYQ